MQTDEVKTIIALLKGKSKFLQATAFESIYVNVKKMTDKAYEISGFFKELKLQELMTSSTIDELSNVLFPLLLQFKKINGKDYDNKRTYQLI
jgi:hypothetical protein